MIFQQNAIFVIYKILSKFCKELYYIIISTQRVTIKIEVINLLKLIKNNPYATLPSYEKLQGDLGG
jgi:Txe/YoeB family toxin of Txe-Axe toxin-antitoxin module